MQRQPYSASTAPLEGNTAGPAETVTTDHLMGKIVQLIDETIRESDRAERRLPIGYDTPLLNLPLDSMAVLILLGKVQAEYGIKTTESDIATIRTVGDIAAYVAGRTGIPMPVST